MQIRFNLSMRLDPDIIIDPWEVQDKLIDVVNEYFESKNPYIKDFNKDDTYGCVRKVKFDEDVALMEFELCTNFEPKVDYFLTFEFESKFEDFLRKDTKIFGVRFGCEVKTYHLSKR